MKILDITEEVWAAKKRVYILPTGFPEEPWSDYIDFKEYRLNYDLVEVEGSYYTINKFGLGFEVSLSRNSENKVIGYNILIEGS